MDTQESRRLKGTLSLSFNLEAGETTKTVAVPILDDELCGQRQNVDAGPPPIIEKEMQL